MKLPAFQFYPGDWMKDPNLKRCTHAAKGVLIDLLCVMFECEERGVLISSGKPWSDDEAAVSVGGHSDVTSLSLRELMEKGVLRRRNDGALYSARMVRDEELRKQDRERQRKFRENDKKGKRNGDSNGVVTPHVTDTSQPSSSSSSPSGISTYKPRDGLPKDESQAAEWASMDGTPPDFAKELFNQLCGRDWVDGAGQPVTNWRSHAKGRWIKRQAELEEKKHRIKSVLRKAPYIQPI